MARLRPVSGGLLAAALLLGSSVAAEPCVDQDERWAAHGTTCAQMARLCDDAGYSALVRSWCPRSCGLCAEDQPARAVAEPSSPANATSEVNETAVAALGGDFMLLEGQGSSPGNGSAASNSTAENRTGLSGKSAADGEEEAPEAPKQCAAESHEASAALTPPLVPTANLAEAQANATEPASVEQEAGIMFADGQEAQRYNRSMGARAAQLEDTTVSNTTSPAANLSSLLIPDTRPVDALHVAAAAEEQVWGSMRRGPRRAESDERDLLDHDNNATLHFDDNSSVDDGMADLEVAWGETRRWRDDDVELGVSPHALDEDRVDGVDTFGVLGKVGAQASGNATAGEPKVANGVEIKALPKGAISLGNEERGGCPEGFEREAGDVHGGDQWQNGYRNQAASIEECAQKCARTPGCGSFEWSQEKKRCYRNSQTRPTRETGKVNFVFCRRTPCPSFKTEEACVGPAVAKGWYSAEVSLSPGSYCIWSGGACQAPMACTSTDCFLPDGGLPGMELPRRYTLWISKAGLDASMKPGARAL